MQEVVDELDAAGIRATYDGRNMHPPCVLVRPPTMHFRYGKPSFDADFEAWCVVIGNGQGNSLPAVSELLTDVQNALGHRGVTATPDDAQLLDGGTVPMYRLTWTQRITA
jgi:hypothetical protein